MMLTCLGFNEEDTAFPYKMVILVRVFFSSSGLHILLPQTYKLTCNILLTLSIFREMQAFYNEMNLIFPSRLQNFGSSNIAYWTFMDVFSRMGFF